MFRPMRRLAQQLEQDVCEQILRTAPRGTLAVLGEGGYPYAIPLNYVYDNGKLYFHCAKQGHKIDALAACDKVSFCVLGKGRQEENDWWYHFDSVIVFGRMRILEDDDAKRNALLKLGGKYFPESYDVEKDVARNWNRVAVLELTVEHMTGKHVREK